MPLHNTEALAIETATAAESLPDPTTVSGRLHELVNTGTVTAVWSSTGATPFTEGGVNVATINVARGETKQFQSDGTRWIAKLKAGGRAFYAATGVTDGAGNVVFTWPVGTFPVAPNVATAVGPGGVPTDVTEARVTALSAASCTVNVRRSPAVVILGISVLQVPVPAVGAQVHLLATSPGTTP